MKLTAFAVTALVAGATAAAATTMDGQTSPALWALAAVTLASESNKKELFGGWGGWGLGGWDGGW